MIAIGWCYADASPLEPCATVKVGNVAVLYVSKNSARDARARALAQLSAVKMLDPFLPLSPKRCMSLNEARALAADRSEDLLARLRSLSGRVQISAHVTWSSPDQACSTAATGRDWLANRCARIGALQSRVEMWSRTLFHAIDVPQSSIVKEVLGPESARFDALVRQSSACDMMKHMAVSARDLRNTLPGQVTVSGVWPGYSFSSLDMCAS